MKNITLIVLLLVPLTSFAGAFDAFIAGLKKDYFFTNTERAIELHNHVRVTKFGPLGRVFNPDAIATYNDKLNIISLDEELLIKVGTETHIKDARLIRRADYSQVHHLSTVFHEMGHAELDTLIENQRETEDAMIHSWYKNTLKSYYKSHHPSFNPHLVFHEHFGYYRSELIDFFENEIGNVLLSNGFNKYKKSCFLNPMLRKKLADGVSLEDFQKFFMTSETDAFYRTKVGPRFVYVKGKDIDLSTGNKAVVDQTHNLFWSYHQKFYNFPINQKDLVARMNQNSDLSKALSECRTKIWNEAHP